MRFDDKDDIMDHIFVGRRGRVPPVLAPEGYRRMVTTVSLNPSFDRIVHVRQFEYGGMNRVTERREYPSGKAVNVAIALSALKLETKVIGFSRSANGAELEKLLLRFGIGSEFIWLDGQIRTNIKLLDEAKSVVTEINEPGEPVDEHAIRRMTGLFCDQAAESDFIVLTGSLPPGCPVNYYRSLIEAVDGTRCRCALDVEGAALTEGIKARPYLIKPNRYELEIAAGRPLNTMNDLIDAARRIADRGVENVAVSMGEHGALMVTREDVLFAPRHCVQVKSTVGAGDSMVAGLVAGFMGQRPMEQVFRMGVAAATASVTTEGAKLIDMETYRNLYKEIVIKRVDRT